MKYFDDEMYFMGGTPKMQYAPGGVTLNKQQYDRIKQLYGSPTANQNNDLWSSSGVRKIASQLGLDPSDFSQGSDFVDLMRNYEKNWSNKSYTPTPVSKGRPSAQQQRREAEEKAYNESNAKSAYQQPRVAAPVRQSAPLQNTPPARQIPVASQPLTLNAFLQENGYGTDVNTKKQIAAALGLNYTGRAEDNIAILKRLQSLEAAPAKAASDSERRISNTLNYDQGSSFNPSISIVDYLNSIGMDASKNARRKYAEALGIDKYGVSGTITAEDNMRLMEAMKNLENAQDVYNQGINDIAPNPSAMFSNDMSNYELSPEFYYSGGEIENDPPIMELYGFQNGGEIIPLPVMPYGFAGQGMEIPVAPYGFNQNGGANYEDGGQMPMDVAVARFKAAGKDKGLSGGELQMYVEKMKSKYNYQKGGAVKETILNNYDISKFGNGGIMYNGTKFAGFNKPVSTSPDDKYKKMMLMEKGGKIKLVKYGYK